jgi:hypothetical protein
MLHRYGTDIRISLASLVFSTLACSSSAPSSNGGTGSPPGAGGVAGGQSDSGGGNPRPGSTGGTGGQAGGASGAPGGAGGTGAGQGGSGGIGGAPTRDGGSGTEAGPATGCPDPMLPPGNRCTSVTKGMGSDSLIDDFEPGPTHTATCHRVREADGRGRGGAWNAGADNVNPMNSVKMTFEPPGPAGAPGSTQALHVVGSGLNGYGGYVATPLAPCYDASAYKGISFWFKGDPAKTPSMKFSAIIPATAEAAQGGTCIQPPPGSTSLQCYDHFTVQVFKVSSVWTRYAFTWEQLTQYGWGQPVPRTLRPETQIIGISFSPDWDPVPGNKATGKAFDFWVDNLSFDINDKYADSSLKAFMSKAAFDAAFAGDRAGTPVNPLLANSYDDLAETLNDPRFSRIGREGSADDRKREIAALLAHVAHETGGLASIVERSPIGDYCVPDQTYPCAPGKTYIGRGPIQFTGNVNYGQGSQYLGLGDMLLKNPDLVAQDPKLAWRTSLFFWMGWKSTSGAPGILFGPHSRFLSDGFGASIKAINGPLECSAPGDPRAQSRKAKYQDFCAKLGVAGCDMKLDCFGM